MKRHLIFTVTFLIATSFFLTACGDGTGYINEIGCEKFRESEGKWIGSSENDTLTINLTDCFDENCVGENCQDLNCQVSDFKNFCRIEIEIIQSGDEKPDYQQERFITETYPIELRDPDKPDSFLKIFVSDISLSGPTLIVEELKDGYFLVPQYYHRQ